MLGGATLKARSGALTSPMTRAPLVPYVLSLDAPEQDHAFSDRMRASLLAKVLFGGDRLDGGAGAWTVVILHILKGAAVERTHTDVSARVVERGIEGLVARVLRSTQARLSLSGAGLHPTTYVPLGAAMLYCIKSMYMDPPERNRMPEMLGAFEAFEAALALVGVDVSPDRPRFETLRWAARLISGCVREGAGRDSECLRRACVDVCAPYVNTIARDDVVLLLDSARTDVCADSESALRLQLLADPRFNPASYTIGKLKLPAAPSAGQIRNLLAIGLGAGVVGHYSEQENDVTNDHNVSVHPRTLRPHLMVPVPCGPAGGGQQQQQQQQLRLWEEAAEERFGPVCKQIPMNKLILEFFVSRGKFPLPGDDAALFELIAYASRSNKCKRTTHMAASAVPVLPENVVNIARSIVEEVAKAVAERRRIYGDEACTPDRIRADILAGERRPARAAMERDS